MRALPGLQRQRPISAGHKESYATELPDNFGFDNLKSMHEGLITVMLMDSSDNEKREITENKEDLKGLYDLAIPLSMPVSVIRELVEKFELDALLRPGKMEMTGEVMDREILVLRGDLETVKAAEKYMFEALDKKIAEWGKKDKEEKYKEFYEEQARLRMKELKENPESACNWNTTSE